MPVRLPDWDLNFVLLWAFGFGLLASNALARSGSHARLCTKASSSEAWDEFEDWELGFWLSQARVRPNLNRNRPYRIASVRQDTQDPQSAENLHSSLTPSSPPRKIRWRGAAERRKLAAQGGGGTAGKM